MSLRFLVVGIFLGLAVCASPPSVDYDIMRARAANPADQLQLFREQSERIAGTKFYDGNDVRLLHNGGATYPEMLADIARATQRIDMESFTFDDEEGQKFAHALLERRRAGVEVNLIYDSIGSYDTSSELFDSMIDGGINVVEYNPVDVTGFIDNSINHRDHRKLLIIDGKIAYTGGINVSAVYRLKQKLKSIVKPEAEEHANDMDPDNLPWRDTQVRIEGPVVVEFEKLFMETWRDQDGEPLNPPPATPEIKRGDLSVQVADGAPYRDRYSIYRSLVVAISLAQKSVHLTTAFFVPTPDLARALRKAAERGVDVTLILPSQTDSDLALDAGRSFYSELMESGVKIYERQGVILHAKTGVIDGIWSTVGSSNLDWRSVIFNNECNAVVLGREFGNKMEDMFKQDLAESRYIDPKIWEERDLEDKIHEWKSRLVEYYL